MQFGKTDEMKMKALLGLLSCCIHLAAGFVSAGGITPTIRSAAASTTELQGGYENGLVGVNPTTPLRFFTLPGNTCPYAQRTHITLIELGLPFDMSEVLMDLGVKPDWYLKINPRGKVPTIQVPTAGYAVIYESAICNEFLCDYAANNEYGLGGGCKNLMPTDPLLRARIRLLNDHCDTMFVKTQFTFLMNKEEEKEEALAAEMENALVVYEDSLNESKGPYLLGEDFTLADVHVFPFLQRLVITLKHWKDYDLSREKFPNLLSWIDACLDRESVKESSMSKEKTIEVYKRFVEAGLNKNKQ